MMKYFTICDETTCQFTKNFIFSYRIIDRITEFSFIIFFRFYKFYGAFYFVYSGLSSVIFSPLPIIYCILLFVCHFFNNNLVRARVQFLIGFIKPLAFCFPQNKGFNDVITLIKSTSWKTQDKDLR